MSDSESNTYGQILKSSSLMAVVSAVTLILGIIRTKFAAVLIGPAGIGLSASFTAIQSFIGTTAGLGIQLSAVREVSAAYSKYDNQGIGTTVLTLQRICWLSGLFGAISMLFLSQLLSQLTFSSNQYQWDIAALGLIILFSSLSGGQTALLQGARRVADMAKAQVMGAVAGTLITVGFYAFLGLRGIIPGLVLTSAAYLLSSWYFAKRLPLPQLQMTWLESLRKAKNMVRLGLIMMWTGLLSSAVSYLTVALIAREVNIQAVGIYNAALALSGMFVNFVLNAMAVDYYPRLIATAYDHVKLNQLVNKQTEIGLLLALPGLIASVLLAPWIVQIFYTKEFWPAAELIQWFSFGFLGRVISWPLGYVILALGKGKWYLVIESIAHIFHLGMVAMCLSLWGLKGVAIAFFLLYVLYSAAVLRVGKVLTKFNWSTANMRIIILCLAITLLSFLLGRSSFGIYKEIFAICLIFFSVIISLRSLTRRMTKDSRFFQTIQTVPFLRTIRKF